MTIRPSPESSRANWALANLGEFLTAIANARSESEAIRWTLESATEALDAEIALVLRDNNITASLGIRPKDVPTDVFDRTPRERHGKIEISGLGLCATLASAVEGHQSTLLAVRQGTEPFAADEAVLLDGMARALSLTLDLLERIERERELRTRSEAMLTITRAMTRGVHHDTLYLMIVEQTTALLRARAVLRTSEHETDLGVRASAGFAPDELRSFVDTVNADSSFTNRRGTAVVEADFALIHRLRAEFPTLFGIFSAPVLLNGVAKGCLSLLVEGESRAFSDSDKALLAALAELASIALSDEHSTRAVLVERHDGLTGLPGRGLVLERLQRALQEYSSVSLLFIDLDDFKPVNDQYGHQVGDEVLRATAKRLQSVLGSLEPVASLGRLGGDEFLVVVTASDDEVDALAFRIVAAIETPIDVTLGATTITTRVSASVGIAVSTECNAIADLLRLGDQAMYRAKSKGKGRWVRSTDLRADTGEPLVVSHLNRG